MAPQFPPTPQQQNVRDARAAGQDVVVQAVAGAGKTSTLRFLADDFQAEGKHGIYTAFNKAIVASAKGKFGDNVNPRTTYGMAWDAGGYAYKRTLDIKNQGLGDVARILNIRGPLYLGSDRAPLGKAKVARQVIATIDAFCMSADDELGAKHVPAIPGAEDAHAHIAAEVLPFAQRAWADMARPATGQLRTKPGLYFKRWALSHPRIPVDFLMVDESQDTDAVLAGVLAEQDHLQRILVGDSAQAIYGWRGCVDIMDSFPDARVCHLTRSFRFGHEVADIANLFMRQIGTDVRVEGFDGRTSTIGKVDAPDAVLTRTNAGAVGEAMRAAADGVKVHLAGAGDKVRAIAKAASELMQGETPWHEELQAFRSWDDVMRYVEDGTASTELETAARLIDENGIADVLAAVENAVDARYADRIITTAHKCKGLEWSRVAIGADWKAPKDRAEPVPADYAMVGYVAVTRAMDHLDLGSLSWIRTWAPVPAAKLPQTPTPLVDPMAGLGPGERRAMEVLLASHLRAQRAGYSPADAADDLRSIIGAYLNQSTAKSA